MKLIAKFLGEALVAYFAIMLLACAIFAMSYELTFWKSVGFSAFIVLFLRIFGPQVIEGIQEEAVRKERQRVIEENE